MNFFHRSTYKLLRGVARWGGVYGSLVLVLVSMVLLIPYWPFGLVTYLLLKEDKQYGDCPGWFRFILKVIDAPRVGIEKWCCWLWFFE